MASEIIPRIITLILTMTIMGVTHYYWGGWGWFWLLMIMITYFIGFRIVKGYHHGEEPPRPPSQTDR